MQILKDRILRDGQNLGDGILKVDGFINHQVDAALMDACGKEFAERFKDVGATKVLTAEIAKDARVFRLCVLRVLCGLMFKTGQARNGEAPFRTAAAAVLSPRATVARA